MYKIRTLLQDEIRCEKSDDNSFYALTKRREPNNQEGSQGLQTEKDKAHDSRIYV